MSSRMKKALLPAACLSLVAIIANLLTIPAPVAQAMPRSQAGGPPPPVLAIRHETDLSEYDRIVSAGGQLTQSSAAALGGTAGGLAVQLGGTERIYGQVDFDPLTSSRYRFGFYFDPNGLAMRIRSVQNLASLFGPSTSPRAWVILRYRDGSYQLRMSVRDDAYAAHDSTWYPITDDEHYVEVLVQYASSVSSSDGSATFWLDGEPQPPITGLDLYDLTKPERVRLGSAWPIRDKTTGTYYIDEFVLRDDDAETIPPDSDNTLASLHHEDDLAEYERMVADGGDLRQSGAAGLGGTRGGLQVTIGDATALYGTKSFDVPEGTAYRFRHYLDPNGISLPRGGQITLAQIRASANRISTRLQYTQLGGYRVYVRFVDDNDNWRNTAFTPVSDGEHYIEVLVEFASSGTAQDGRVTYWVDDTQRDQVTGLNLYQPYRRPNQVQFGASWISQAGTSGTLYLDEFVLNDDGAYIGPADGSGSTPATATPTTVPTGAATSTAVPTATPTGAPTNTPGPTFTPTTAPTVAATNTPRPTATPTTVPTTVPTNTPVPTPTPTRSTDSPGVQWQKLDTTGGGGESALAFHPTNPNIIYTIGDNGGAYKTEDGGNQWVSISNNMGVYRMSDIALDPLNPEIIYAAAATGWSAPPAAGNTGELHRSTNGGRSWRFLSDQMGFKPSSASQSIYLPRDPTALNRFDRDRDRVTDVVILGAWIGPNDAPIGGVWRSEDEGRTFRQVALQNRNITALRGFDQDPMLLYLTTYDGHLYRSNDLGQTWGDITGSLPLRRLDDLAIHPTNRNILYVTGRPSRTGQSPVWKTTDAGASWQAVGNGLDTERIVQFPRILIDRFDPQTLYLTTSSARINSGGVYKSTNGGQTWQQMPFRLVLPDGRPYLWYHFDKGFSIGQAVDGRLYTGTWNSVWRYPAGPQARDLVWEPAPIGIGNVHVNTIVVDPSNSRVLYEGISDFGPYKSVDRGETFHRVLGNGWPVTTSNYVWNGPYYSNYTNCQLACSTSCTADGRIAAGGTTGFAISYQNSNVIYSSFGSGSNRNSHGGVNKSTDGGRTWQPVGFQLNGGFELNPTSCVPYGIRALAIDPRDDQIVFAAQELGDGSNARLYRTTNGGRTWQLVFTPSNSYVRGLEVSTVNPQTVVLVTNSGVYRSVQGGAAGSWQSVRLPSPSDNAPLLLRALALSPHDRNVWVVGTHSHGFFYTADGGATWTNNNLQAFFEQRVAWNNGSLLSPDIATANNPIYTTRRDISAVAFDPAQPDTFYVTGSQRPRAAVGVAKITAAGTQWIRLPLEGLTHRNIYDLTTDASGSYLYAATNDGTFEIRLR